jgi:hypothetical protein
MDGEVAQAASGGDIHRRRGSSGDQRWSARAPTVSKKEGEGEARFNWSSKPRGDGAHRGGGNRRRRRPGKQRGAAKVRSLAQTKGREGGGGVLGVDERAQRGKRGPGSAPPFFYWCGEGGKGTGDAWRQEKWGLGQQREGEGQEKRGDAWAGPGKRVVGRAQMNRKKFRFIQLNFKLV